MISTKVLKIKLIPSVCVVLAIYLLCLFLPNLSTLLSVHAAEGNNPFHWVETSYENVFRDDEKRDESRETVDILMVRNEFESEQVILKHTSDFDITDITFSDLSSQKGAKILKNNLSYNFVGYVEMNNSVGQNASTVVRWTGSTSTSANSNSMQWFPDRLYNRSQISVKANEAQPIYINVYAPKDAVADLYTGTALISTSVGEINVNMSVEVADVTIADSEDASFTQAYWQQLANTWKKDVYGIGELYGHEKYSKEWWELMGNVADGLRETRINSLAIYPLQLLLDGDTSLDKNSGLYNFDFTRFDEFISFFMDKGAVKYLEGNALLGTTYATNTWGFILANKEDDSGLYLKKVEPLYPDYTTSTLGDMNGECENFYTQYIKALNEHLELKGWKDRWIQHIEDEAGSKREQTEYMDFVNRIFKPNMPNVRFGDPMDHNFAPWFLENTDFQIPLTTQFDGNRNLYNNAISQGGEVWMYSCLNPQGAALNKLVDKPVWQIRSLAWLSYAYGVTGHLQWSYNGWWTEAATGEVYVGQDEVNIQRFKYKGDDFYVYPDMQNNTFEQSIRSISSRDSAEEYEILNIVGNRDLEHYAWTKELISKIVTSNNNYSKDTSLMAETRAELIRVAAGKRIDIPTTPELVDDEPLFSQAEMPSAAISASFEDNLDVSTSGTYSLTKAGTGIGYTDVSKKGKAIEYKGDNDTFLTMADSAGVMFNPAETSFSVSVWLNPNKNDNEPVIVGQQGANGRTWLYVGKGGIIASFFGGSEGNFETAKVLQLNQWTHVAVTVQNIQSGRGIATTYVNGVAEKTGEVAIDSGTMPLIIGRHKNGGATVKYYQGSMDELRVFEQALSAEQIYSEYYYNYPPKYYSSEDVEFVSARGGSLPSLPEKVKVILDNGMKKYVDVQWGGEFVPGDLESAGIKTREGTFTYDGSSYTIIASMTVYDIVAVGTSLETLQGLAPEMPKAVTVTDGTNKFLSRVIWNSVPENKYSTEGEYTVKGYLPEVSGVIVSQKVSVIAVGDKEALFIAANNAAGLVQTDYTAGSWLNYITKIDEAKKLLQKYKPFATEVNPLLLSISEKKDGLVNISVLKKLYENNLGKDEKGYTADSFTNFKTKLVAAKTILDNENATKAQVDTAKSDLESAILALTAETTKPIEDKKGCGTIAIMGGGSFGGTALILISGFVILSVITKRKKLNNKI